MESEKSRIKSVLNYKKPAFWIILVAIIAGIVVAVCFLALPKNDKAPVGHSVLQWFDYEDDFSKIPRDSAVETTVDTFPGVTFLGTDDMVQAREDGKTRTLFCGMPITNVYFTDVTGDGKPELCATVYFGSGIVDSHVVIYDYVNKQAYALWDRMQFDYHLYTVDGALLVGKTPHQTGYPVDKQIDAGTLMQQDGELYAEWQSDGSRTPLFRMLHESDLYGEWVVTEERDGDDNLLYTQSITSWKVYDFKEDGTVVYNEINPVSSDSEQAFGHPVAYPYAVYDGWVFIDIDNSEGFSRTGYRIESDGLQIMYQTTPPHFVYATLRRMGSETGETP